MPATDPGTGGETENVTYCALIIFILLYLIPGISPYQILQYLVMDKKQKPIYVPYGNTKS